MVRPAAAVNYCEELGRFHATIRCACCLCAHEKGHATIALRIVSEDEISLEVGCDAAVAMELAETFTLAKPQSSSLAGGLSSPPPKTASEPSPDALPGTDGDNSKTKVDPPKKKAKAKAAPKQALRFCVTVCVALSLANHLINLRHRAPDRALAWSSTWLETWRSSRKPGWQRQTPPPARRPQHVPCFRAGDTSLTSWDACLDML